MTSEPTVPFAAIQDGQTARIGGTVRAMDAALLTAPVSRRRCVYFEVRSGVAATTPGERLEHQGQDFFLEGSDGRALVVMDRCEVVVGDDEQEVLVAVLEADIKELSRSLRELKRAVRRAAPGKQRQLHQRLREDKALATWLCALRAHRRGNLHHGRNLTEQARFIEERRAAYEQQGRQREVSARHLDRYDLVIEPGAEVEVVGLCHWEPDPDPAAKASGYRQRARRLVVAAPAEGGLRVWAGHETARTQAEERARAERADARTRRDKRDTTFGCLFLVAVAALLAGASWLVFC